MPSWRRFSRTAFESGYYEAEDILRETDRVDLLELEPVSGFQLRRKWHSRLLKRDVTRRAAHVNPGLRQFASAGNTTCSSLCATSRETWCTSMPSTGWKDHCRKSVCVLDELWAADAMASERYLHILKRFDFVLLG